MIPSLRRLATGAALSAVTLVGLAAAGHAQNAGPIANGHAAVQGIPAGTTSTTFSLVQLPDGSLVGNGVSTNSLGGWVRFDLTSVMTIGDAVLMAGPITATFNAPPQFVVGGTYFIGVKDNGEGGTTPDEFANGAVPFPLSIQQIIGVLGPPPPEVFRPLVSGDIQVH
jgi:hypothetical protein